MKRTTKTKSEGSVIFLNVYDMKADRKKRGGKPYDFNAFRDALVADGANVYPVEDGDKMAIEGTDMQNVKKYARKCKLGDVAKYITKDNSLDDAVYSKYRFDDLHEEDSEYIDAQGHDMRTGEDYEANDRAWMGENDFPDYEDVNIDDEEDNDFPAYDEVDIEDDDEDDDRRSCKNCGDDEDCCGEVCMEDCHEIVRGAIEDGDMILSEFRKHMDKYLAKAFGVEEDELDDIDDDEIDCVTEMLYRAWIDVEEEELIDDLKELDALDALDTEKDDENDDEMEEAMLYEKRRRCCPPRSLHESLYAKDEKDQEKLKEIEKNVKAEYNKIKTMPLSVHEVREAMKKLKSENAKLRKIENRDGKNYSIMDVPGAKAAFKKMKERDADKAKEIEKFEKTLAEKVVYNLKHNKKSLHENVKVNGKYLKDMDMNTLNRLYESVREDSDSLMRDLTMSPSMKKRAELRAKMNKKNTLLEYVDQEITYRATRRKCLNRLNEDEDMSATISNEELDNLFGPAQGESTDSKEKDTKKEDSKKKGSEENGEDTENIELDTIQVEFTTEEAANQFKDWCVEAGIPEDVLDVHEVEEDEDEESEEEEGSDEENTEENNDTENSDESTEDNSEEDSANESLGYNLRKLLFEDAEDGSEDNAEEETPAEGEGSEENAEESNDEGEGDGEGDEENDEDAHFVCVLTDTKYTTTLLGVFDDKYGISKDEVEEQIGGEIEEREDEEDDEEATEGASDGEGDSKDNGDDSDEDFDPNELFKGL